VIIPYTRNNFSLHCSFDSKRGFCYKESVQPFYNLVWTSSFVVPSLTTIGGLQIDYSELTNYVSKGYVVYVKHVDVIFIFPKRNNIVKIPSLNLGITIIVAPKALITLKKGCLWRGLIKPYALVINPRSNQVRLLNLVEMRLGVSILFGRMTWVGSYNTVKPVENSMVVAAIILPPF